MESWSKTRKWYEQYHKRNRIKQLKEIQKQSVDEKETKEDNR